MDFLQKKNWFLSLIMMVLTQGLFSMILAYFLKVYEKERWYTKWQYWVVSGLFLFFPIFIVLAVFIVQISCQVAAKLNVPGERVYNTPYSWILCLVVPIVGWTLLIVMLIYIYVWPIVMIYKGEGEKYAE